TGRGARAQDAKREGGGAAAAGGRGKKKRRRPPRRGPPARRSDYAARLAQASLLAEREPGQAVALLEDPQFCPPELRDFTWDLIHAASQRSLFSFRVHDAAAPAVLHIGEDAADRAAGAVPFLDDNLT